MCYRDASCAGIFFVAKAKPTVMKIVSHLYLLALLLVAGCERFDVVMSGLSQNEANESLVLLREHGIDAHKESEPSKKTPLFQIKVKQDQADNALNILVEYRMPRSVRAGLKDIYPPGSSGLIPTKNEEHARFLMASQGEIEALFKVIPGIKDARVVLSFDPPSEFGKTAKKTASVVLLYQTDQERDHPPLSDAEAKNLVASSVNGLVAEDVVVVQKTLGTPKANVHDEHVAVTSAIKEEGTEKHMMWYMLIVTIMAIVVAFYGVFRLFVQRRVRV